MPEWKLAAERHRSEDGVDRFTLEVKPPSGRKVPADAYFFSYARLVDSHGPQEQSVEPDGSVRIALRLTESPDAIPAVLEGELFSKAGWDARGRNLLLKVKVPLEAPR